MKAFTDNLRRIVRLGLGISILIAAILVVYDQFWRCRSQVAVIGAPLVGVSSPIAGYVDVGPVSTEGIVALDTVLARVRDPFTYKGALFQAQHHVAETRGRLDAVSLSASEKARFHKAASHDASVSITSTRQELGERVALLGTAVTALEDRRTQLTNELERVTRLSREGIASEAEVTVTRTQLKAAEAEAARTAVELGTARTLLQGQGALVESYAKMHRDELQIDVVDATSARSALLAQHAAALELAQKWEADSRMRSDVSVGSPVRGRVWLRYASTGEFVHQSQRLFRLADCSKPLIFARLTAMAFRRVSVGTEASVILIPSGEKYSAAVIQKLGDAIGPDGEPPFAAPGVALESGTGSARETFLVVLSIKGFDQRRLESCDLGASAQVHFHVPVSTLLTTLSASLWG